MIPAEDAPSYDADDVKAALLGMGHARVVRALALEGASYRERGRTWFLCPWHGDRSPSATLSVGPRGSLLATCYACGHSTDVLGLVAAASGLSVDVDYPAVLAEAATLAGVRPADPLQSRRPRRPVPPPPPPNYPAAAELEAVFSAAIAVTDHPAARRALERRGLSPDIVRDLGLAGAIPDGALLPRWATVRGVSWADGGYAMVLPAWAVKTHPQGKEPPTLEVRGVRAWHVASDLPEGWPKRVAPALHTASGLVLADPKARALIAAGKPCRLVVAEGEPDFLSLSTRAALLGRPYGVLAVVNGSWSEEWAAIIPEGSQVAVCTDRGQAGDRYAADIARLAAGRYDVLRAPPEGSHAPAVSADGEVEEPRPYDLNDMLLAGALDAFDPFASAAGPLPERAPLPPGESDGREFMTQWFADFRAGKGRAEPTTTGYRDLDELLVGGFRPGELWVLAGRAGMGKSAAMMGMVAGHLLCPTAPALALYSVEMMRDELLPRLASRESGVPLWRLRRPGVPEDADVIAVGDALSRLAPATWRLSDATITVDELVRRVRSYAAELRRDGQRLGLVVVDYLQHLRDANPRASKRENVMHTCAELKALAIDERLTVLALAQVNREVESRTDKRPCLSDLKEAGAIEEDADGVIFVYRQSYYDADSAQENEEGEFLIRKHRNGPQGTVLVDWHGATTGYYDTRNKRSR